MVSTSNSMESINTSAASRCKYMVEFSIDTQKILIALKCTLSEISKRSDIFNDKNYSNVPGNVDCTGHKCCCSHCA